MKKNNSKMKATFMAVKVGKESTEGSFQLYKGMAAFYVVGVNPTKAELSALFGREMNEEPEYVGKTEEGKRTVRITFYVKTSDSKLNSGIDLRANISFNLTEAPHIGKDSGKTKIIDRYGRTAWATDEDMRTQSIPVYSKGPANISKEYRPAFINEDLLMNFLSKWLNIPAPANYKDGKWVDKADMSASENSLDMEKLFSGDFSELKELVAVAGPYVVKAAVGIKTTEGENGTKQYQSVFNREFAKNASTDYSKIDVALTDFQANGGAPGTEFSILPLHPNVVEATTFTAPATGAPISAPTAASSTPWD